MITSSEAAIAEARSSSADADPGAATKVLRAELELVRDPVVRCRLLTELSFAGWMNARFESSRRSAVQAVDLATGPASEVNAQAHAMRALSVAVIGPNSRTGLDDVRAALTAAEQAVDAFPAISSWGLYLLAEAAMAAGEIDVATKASERAVADRPADPLEGSLTSQVRARALAFAGRLEEAEAEARHLVQLCLDHPVRGIEPLAHGLNAFLAAQRGESATVRTAVRATLATAQSPANNYIHAGAHTLAGYALAADGQYALAAATVLAGGGADLGRMQFVDKAYGYELLAGAALATGDLDNAQHWLARARALPADGMAAAAVSRTEAMVGAAVGEGDADAAKRAATDAERVGGHLDAARARVLHGSALSRLGSRQRALDELERVALAATALGALRIRTLAVREMRALGRRMSPPGRDVLSPRETQVALLAADGLSNRQIARLLQVSERTVQSHLVTIMRRLDLSSRAGLPRALAAPTAAGAPMCVELTDRQRAVVALVARGWSNTQVADELGVSTKTVEKHVADAFTRCGVRSRTALAAYWQAHA